MVRPRLALERLEGDLIRDHVFLKNKATMTDKVRELSILTGADVAFLAFSPRGIPTLALGQHSNFSDIVTRFSNVHFYDREKRRLDVLQTLKGNFQQRGYSIDLDSLYGNWKKRRLEDLNEESVFLKGHLSELSYKKQVLEDPNRINSIEEAKKVQESLERHIQRLQMRKDRLNYTHTPNWCQSQVPGAIQQTTTMLTSLVPGGFQPETMFNSQPPGGSFDLASMLYGNGGAYDTSGMIGGHGFNDYGSYNLGSYIPLDDRLQQPNLEFGKPHGLRNLD